VLCQLATGAEPTSKSCALGPEFAANVIAAAVRDALRAAGFERGFVGLWSGNVVGR